MSERGVNSIQGLQAIEPDEQHGSMCFNQQCFVSSHDHSLLSAVHSSSSGNGAKIASISSSLTSSKRGGIHFGRSSLSMTKARTPSLKSGLRASREETRYSSCMISENWVSIRHSASARRATLQERGDFLRISAR